MPESITVAIRRDPVTSSRLSSFAADCPAGLLHKRVSARDLPKVGRDLAGKTGFILVSMYRRATATDYCFGGNKDCGGETCIGLDESWIEGCAGCCAGFGSGVETRNNVQRVMENLQVYGDCTDRLAKLPAAWRIAAIHPASAVSID
jgi:hypothetical protein